MGRLKLLDTQALFTVQHVSSLVHRLPRQASEVRLQINTVLAAQWVLGRCVETGAVKLNALYVTLHSLEDHRKHVCLHVRKPI